VCRQLDGLSHFYFAPKPEVEEFAVKPMAVASISLEDILPTTRTASTLSSSLAPEQIHEKKRGRDAAFLSAGEADRDDRQRLRRAKKAVRNKSRKAEALERGVDLAQPMKKDKRVVVAAETTNSSKSYSKSARFFSEMQKTVTADVLHRSSKDHKSAAVGGAGASSQNLKL
jgi:U3 small nucleolar ribonucleoprotein component